MGTKPLVRIAAAVTHAYTATGAVLAVWAAFSVDQGNIRLAWLILFLAAVVDYTDGMLSRVTKSAEVLPGVDGDHLDSLVDAIVNAVVPIYLLIRLDVLPRPAMLWGAVFLIPAVIRYARANPLWDKGFLWGFPPAGVMLAFYIVEWRLPPAVIGSLFIAHSALCAAPLGFLHARRFPRLRFLNSSSVLLWWAFYLLITQRFVELSDLWFVASLLPLAYYIVASVYFDRQRRSAVAIPV